MLAFAQQKQCPFVRAITPVFPASQQKRWVSLVVFSNSNFVMCQRLHAAGSTHIHYSISSHKPRTAAGAALEHSRQKKEEVWLRTTTVVGDSHTHTHGCFSTALRRRNIVETQNSVDEFEKLVPTNVGVKRVDYFFFFLSLG